MASKEEISELVKALNKTKGIGGKEGAGTTVFGDDLSLSSHVSYGIPTRIPELDLSIGRPGYPAGRVMEFYGLPMSGKTTAAYHALAQVQKMGGLAALIDTERTFDKKRAIDLGIDPSNLLVSEANDIEEIFEKILTIVEFYKEHISADTPGLIAVDSVTAVETRTDAERTMSDGSRVGENARIIRRGCQKITKVLAETGIAVIFINHSTAKVGVTFGEQSDSAGGNAIKFWSTIRLRFTNTGNIFEGERGADRTRRGQVVKLIPVKNKINATGQYELDLELTEGGFDIYDSLFEAFQKIKALEKINNQTFFFKPTETQVTRKEWKALVDTYTNEEGKILGVDGFYKYFLRLAQNDGHIRPYGVD